jgi:uncharacterized protein YaaN involved in tellurite resistance
MTSGFVFDEPVEVLPVPAVPEGNVSNGLATITTDPVKRTSLMCSAFLAPDRRQVAVAEANQLLPKMLVDSTTFINYGVDAMAALNRLVDKVLTDVKPTRIPEVQTGMQELKQKMSAARGNYDLADPKTKERLSKAVALAGKPRKFWQKTTDIFSAFQTQMQDIIDQIDKLEADLTGRAVELTRNAEFCVELYNENDREIEKLFYVIAVMEMVLEQARIEAGNIPQGTPGDLADRNNELRGKYADLISALDVKIGEYKSRLFVAWASAPQLRMMRQMDVDMAMKMHTLVQSALPTTKLVIVQWRMMLQGEENARVGEAVQDFTRYTVEGYFTSAAQVMPTIAQSIQRQTLTPETVNVVVDSLTNMIDGIGAAYQQGQQNRQVMDQTMLQAQQQLSNVKGKVDDNVINNIIGAATKPQLALEMARR